MGLDIYVKRPEALGNRKIKDVEYPWVVTDDLELIKHFGHLTYEKTNQYYDVIAAIELKGFNPDDLISEGYSFGKNAEFYFTNGKHELYEASEFLQKTWSLYFAGKPV